MAFADLLAVGDQLLREVLGEVVTYTPGVGDPVDVDGVFDAAHVVVDLGPNGVASPGPAVFLTLADLPSDPVSDTDATVTVGGVEYTFHEVKPDGQGGVYLLLHRA